MTYLNEEEFLKKTKEIGHKLNEEFLIYLKDKSNEDKSIINFLHKKYSDDVLMESIAISSFMETANEKVIIAKKFRMQKDMKKLNDALEEFRMQKDMKKLNDALEDVLK